MEDKDKNQIQWFPGHMAKTLREIDAEIKTCNAIIYVLDARCPISCLNPKFYTHLNRKPVLFALNKADLGDTRGVNEYLRKILPSDIKWSLVALDATKSGAGKKIERQIVSLCADKIESAKRKGVKTSLRAIVIGVTNCGKSTLINNLAKSAKTKTGDKPGVTRARQWVSVGDYLWLLDTPGTLWPQFTNSQIAKNLAYVGSVKDEVLNTVWLARSLISDLKKLSQDCIVNRFGAHDFDDICKKRGYILRGGEIDELRAAKAILVEFRAGKIGKFNLDKLFLIDA